MKVTGAESYRLATSWARHSVDKSSVFGGRNFPSYKKYIPFLGHFYPIKWEKYLKIRP